MSGTRADGLRPLRTHWRVLVVNCVLCAATGLALAYLLPKRYTARASILPPREEQTGLSASGLVRGLDLPGVQLPAPVSPTEMLLPALESERLRAAVARRCDPRRVYGVRDSLDALERLRKKSVFKVTPRNLLEIEVVAPSARDAAALADAYVVELDGLLRGLRASRARQARMALGRRLGETRARLDSIGSGLADYLQTHHAAASDLRGAAGGGGAGALAAEQVALRARLRWVRGYAADSSREVRDLAGRLAALERVLDRLPPQATEAARAMRDLVAGERAFAFLAAQYEGARLEEARDLPALVALDAPAPPRRPSWPRARHFVAGALLVALIAGAGWAAAAAGAAGGAAKAAAARAATPWRTLAGLGLAEAALLAVGARFGWLPAVLVALAAAVLWRMGPDLRWPFVMALGAGVFTVYGGGQLTRELSIVTFFGVLAGALGLREYALRGWSLSRNPLTMVLAGWILVALYGAALGVVRENSLKYLGIDMSGSFGILTALLAPLWRARRRAFLAFLGAFTFLSYVSAAYGLVAFVRYRRRIGDAWFGPLPAMGALLLVSVAAHAPHRGVRWAALLLIPVLLLHQLLSFTRGYWLGFLAGLLTVLVVIVAGSRDRGRAALRAAGVGLALGLLAAGSFLAAQQLAGGDLAASVGSRFGSSFTTEAGTATMSNIVRLAEWGVAIEQISQHPLIGHGAGATLSVKDPFVGFRNEAPYIHQMYLFEWFKYGLAGLIALLLLFWAFGRAGWREGLAAPTWERRAVGTAVLANTLLMAVVCTSNFTLNLVFAGPPLAFLWGLLLPVDGPEGRSRIEWQGEAS
ncbi:MAG: hypothetical protein HZB25_09945 [Candidatus Eisenbacteria bacterium]|nr:hypothetical protein [Candidatus Eisenbacteria bacterium]